jgi:hypothetical protein
MAKRPKSFNPKVSKQPRHEKNPDNFLDMNVCWQFRRMEFNANSFWDWNDVLSDRRVYNTLSNYETMKLREVRNRKNHLIPVNDLNKIAKNILEKKGLYDVESLQSFHIIGNIRVYCIPKGNVMQLLWYDIYHDDVKRGVCPSPKKHT